MTNWAKRLHLNNLDDCIAAMKKYSGRILAGVNEYDEPQIITIKKDRIEFLTSQEDGWVRLDIWHKDGTTEEIYTGRWDKYE